VELALELWRKKRVRKPDPIGRKAGDSRCKLYECAALADYVMKVAEHIEISQSILTKRLSYISQEPAR
jgi:hypothetical protein